MPLIHLPGLQPGGESGDTSGCRLPDLRWGSVRAHRGPGRAPGLTLMPRPQVRSALQRMTEKAAKASMVQTQGPRGGRSHQQPGPSCCDLLSGTLQSPGPGIRSLGGGGPPPCHRDCTPKAFGSQKYGLPPLVGATQCLCFPSSQVELGGQWHILLTHLKDREPEAQGILQPWCLGEGLEMAAFLLPPPRGHRGPWCPGLPSLGIRAEGLRGGGGFSKVVEWMRFGALRWGMG